MQNIEFKTKDIEISVYFTLKIHKIYVITYICQMQHPVGFYHYTESVTCSFEVDD